MMTQKMYHYLGKRIELMSNRDEVVKLALAQLIFLVQQNVVCAPEFETFAFKIPSVIYWAEKLFA